MKNKILLILLFLITNNLYAKLSCSVANTDLYYINHPDINKDNQRINEFELKKIINKYDVKITNKEYSIKSIHYSNYEYSLSSYQFEIQKIREQFPNQNPFVILNYKNRIKDEAFNIFEQKASKETKKLIGAIKAVDATFKVVIHIKRDST